jgi:hypothetical protein
MSSIDEIIDFYKRKVNVKKLDANLLLTVEERIRALEARVALEERRRVARRLQAKHRRALQKTSGKTL